MRLKTSLVVPLALLGACGGRGGLEELPPAPVYAGAQPAERAPTYRVRPQDEAPPAQQPQPAAPPSPQYSGQQPSPTMEGAPPSSQGPQGSSQLRPGEERYDRVGYAGYAGAGDGHYALSAVLPAGSFAEVTALDTGRTILIQVRGPGSGLIDLSAAAAQQLGVTGTPPVRVRRVTVTAQDQALLSAGRPVSPRADAPPVLLNGLRKRLGERGTARTEPPTPAPASSAATSRPTPQRPAPAQRATRGLFVQVAALSNAARARDLASQLGGIVRPARGLYLVQIGPFDSNAAAERARADVARRGYGDARLVSVP
ncbi:SPOR domain-containing protein [Sphingomonas sp.]|uniref:SPOR domain-containing protein n=1 Tax=Sphingomonas sp. TaxID=28214 RepID=UPI001EB87C2B|nr:SPOR domain-containing protein [Sphingomonas sp.]MBX3593900.1 SPOR domain-containing protein [Sphingomonas sp.]